MKTRDYDKMYDETTGSTETHLAVDTKMKHVIDFDSSIEDRNAFEEGFAAASGVRAETAETDGRVRHPETKDAARLEPDSKADEAAELIEEENSGLADS